MSPTTKHSGSGILSAAQTEKREEIVELLTQAYWMEVETVTNYLAASINLDGVRGRDVAEDLKGEVADELGHAEKYGARLKVLYGTVPGSADFPHDQSFLQPPEDNADVVAIIKGVIEAEAGAIAHYNRIIEATDGVDWATQDMVIEILRDEEEHMRKYENYLREYEG